MLLHSPVVDRLIEAFRRLPGVGKRSAERMALHLLSTPEEDAHALAVALTDARNSIVSCSICCDLSETDPCNICSDERRDHSLICVVEKPSGAMAIEKGGTYRGVYHVLHGTLNPLEGIGPDELQIDKLMRRLDEGNVAELIVATNATAEGEATAMYLSRQVASRGVKVSRIAHGVPMGGGLEYSDDVTLSHALRGRTTM
ncbi:MAG: recombination protein RecR [Candidatus Hydrogenedentes bacterium]|nr:recombination protein RecR [Candidatus Hydrogenedentota bacterium]